MKSSIESLDPITESVDPFHYVDSTDYKNMCCVTWECGVGMKAMPGGRNARLVIGPDLIGEWKAKHPKK